jgi:hypothetical protein
MKRAFSVFAIVAIFALALLGATFHVGQPNYQWGVQTVVGATDVVCFNSNNPSSHTVTVVVTGSPATCTYSLKAASDGATFVDISGPQSCTSTVQFSVVNHPEQCVEGYLDTLTGGTSPTVTASYAGQ